MSRLRTLVILSVCATLISANRTWAGSATKEIGNYMQVIIPAYAFGMTMNEHDYQGAIQFGETFIATQGTVWGLKALVDEPRPNKSNNNSFPSGHTAAAFSGATFIHKRYGLQWALVPYMMATFTGYSRIESDMHYLHDVLAGAAIGSSFAWLFASKYDNICVSAGPSDVKVSWKTSF